MTSQTQHAESMTENKKRGCPIHALIEWKATGSLGSRLAILAFGLIAYIAFFGTILYSIGFVGDFIVPKSINSGTPGPLIPSLLINGSLLVVFVVQHTIMARSRFKLWFTKFVPNAMERSTFVLLSSVILMATYWLWQPLPEMVWSVNNPITSNGLWVLFGLGWVLVFASTFMLSHFDLFGLRQITMNAAGKTYRPIEFRLVWLYKIVRHPLMLGFIVAFWATPQMSIGHLFFAIMTTGYIIFGTWIEERDLVSAFGESYIEYRQRVRGLIPLPKFHSTKETNS